MPMRKKLNLKNRFIPVNVPKIFNHEKKYIKKCLNEAWVSSEGNYELKSKIANNKIKISVSYFNKNKNILNAIQVGKIKLLTTGSLFIGIIKGKAFPAKPMINILFEALKLLIKGAIFKKIDVINKHKTSLAKKS